MAIFKKRAVDGLHNNLATWGQGVPFQVNFSNDISSEILKLYKLITN